MMNGYGWDWYWMAPMMAFWTIVLGAIIYAAVRLAMHDEHHHTPHNP
jgi:hypothetical protein